MDFGEKLAILTKQGIERQVAVFEAEAARLFRNYIEDAMEKRAGEGKTSWSTEKEIETWGLAEAIRRLLVSQGLQVTVYHSIEGPYNITATWDHLMKK